jgi:uncharacterized protein
MTTTSPSAGRDATGERRRRRRAWVVKRLAVLALLPLVWLWQTRGLVVERSRVPVPGLRGTLRVVVLADLHLTGNQGPLGLHATPGYLRRVADVAARLRPDVLLLLGDLADTRDGGEVDAIEAGRIVAAIPARYGCYAVAGNHEAWMDLTCIEEGWRGEGVDVLEDDWRVLETEAGALTIGGLAWRETRQHYDVDTFVAHAPGGAARLVLCHDPAVAKDLTAAPAACLIVSGHTHGGQVWFPFVGAPWTPSRAIPEYLRGMYRLGPSSRLYISRGVGTNALPTRFLSRPEVTLLLLEPEAA